MQLDFVDNTIVNGPGPDLVVSEIHGAEGFALPVFDSIREYSEPRNYDVTPTGFVQNGCVAETYAINAVAVDLSNLFRYVRLTDDPNEGDVTGCSAGADIDAVAVLSPNPWVNMGHALAGQNGPPFFAAAGPLVGNGQIDFAVSNGNPGASAYFVLGITNFSAPFKGGVLVPHPDLVIGGLPIDLTGVLAFPLIWPTGLPAGIEIFIQFWIQDAGGPFGFAATNALKSLTMGG